VYVGSPTNTLSISCTGLGGTSTQDVIVLMSVACNAYPGTQIQCLTPNTCEPDLQNPGYETCMQR
jgi:hypothetical protein